MSDSPYSVPKSNLVNKNIISRSILWKIYFIIMALFTLLGVIGFFSVEGMGVAELISTFLVIPGLVGFFGYIYSKKILVRKIWILNFYVQIIWGVSYYFVTTADLSADMNQQTYLLMNGIMWMISIPYYFALYLYSSKNYHLWFKTA